MKPNCKRYASPFPPLSRFPTLASVTAEINQWWQTGRSCFTRLLTKMKLSKPTASVLDQVLPAPDG